MHSATPRSEVHSNGFTPVDDASAVCPKCRMQKREGERHQCPDTALHLSHSHNHTSQSRQSSDSSLSTCSSMDEERGSQGNKEELQAFLHELYWPLAEEENNGNEDESDHVVEALPVQL